MLLNTDDYFTAGEAANELGVTTKTIYHWAKNGLESERHWGMHFFRKDVVAAFVPPRGSYQKRRRP